MNNSITQKVRQKLTPPLDPSFVPAALWNRAFRATVKESGRGREVAIEIDQAPGAAVVYRTGILPEGHPDEDLNFFYLERIFKFLLWQTGGWKITIVGAPELAVRLAALYGKDGLRAFDSNIIGESVYGHPLDIRSADAVDEQSEDAAGSSLGRHLDGCRIGFDLGGSDRKCAAVIDGRMVFSEEIPWNPYFEKDPAYHRSGIEDSLSRAAKHLPRVDAIGGSSAGIYVNNEVRVASLFRGVPGDVFDREVRGMFKDIGKAWNVPMEVVNDGEVTALAGSMNAGVNAVLGVAMGTSEAAGYVTPGGGITSWLNELAFAPVDYRIDGPADEWSGDAGCGVQYFSQQAVGRLAGLAGIEEGADLPLAERLVCVQELMAKGDSKARSIYESIGIYFGYTCAHYADFYQVENILMLGRVMSGDGGDIIREVADKVLEDEFPELSEQITLRVPGEQEKRHGQAVAAASLPEIG